MAFGITKIDIKIIEHSFYLEDKKSIPIFQYYRNITPVLKVVFKENVKLHLLCKRPNRNFKIVIILKKY